MSSCLSLSRAFVTWIMCLTSESIAWYTCYSVIDCWTKIVLFNTTKPHTKETERRNNFAASIQWMHTRERDGEMWKTGIATIKTAQRSKWRSSLYARVTCMFVYVWVWVSVGEYRICYLEFVVAVVVVVIVIVCRIQFVFLSFTISFAIFESEFGVVFILVAVIECCVCVPFCEW